MQDKSPEEKLSPVKWKTQTMYDNVMEDHNYLVMVKEENEDNDVSTSNIYDDNGIASDNTGNAENEQQMQYAENTRLIQYVGYLDDGQIRSNCKFCDRTFNKRAKLFEHENRHQNIRAYQCSYCDKSYFYKNNLSKHEKNHSGPKPYKCNICGKCFSSNKVLILHNQRHVRDEQDWTCIICQLNCKSKQGLLDHQKSDHGDIYMPLKCELCTKRFQLPEQLKMHMRYHKKSHLCSECGKGFISGEKLLVHERTHRYYTCDFCPRICLGLNSLKNHTRCCRYRHMKSEDAIEHYEKMEKKKKDAVASSRPKKPQTKKKMLSCIGLKTNRIRHKCEVCPRTFASHRLMRGHCNKMHANCRYSCDNCKMKFWKEDSFVTHRTIQICATCNKPFSCASFYRLHQKRHVVPSFACDLCDRKFVQKSHLMLHRKTHDDKTFPCEQCSRVFRFNSHLDQHMKSHREREFKCTTCDKGFWRKFDLEIHERTHTGEKPFMCSVCAACFISARALDGHEQVHVPMPHICETCGKGFRTPEPYEKHMKEHSKIRKRKKPDPNNPTRKRKKVDSEGTDGNEVRTKRKYTKRADKILEPQRQKRKYTKKKEKKIGNETKKKGTVQFVDLVEENSGTADTSETEEEKHVADQVTIDAAISQGMEVETVDGETCFTFTEGAVIEIMDQKISLDNMMNQDVKVETLNGQTYLTFTPGTDTEDDEEDDKPELSVAIENIPQLSGEITLPADQRDNRPAVATEYATFNTFQTLTEM